MDKSAPILPIPEPPSSILNSQPSSLAEKNRQDTRPEDACNQSSRLDKESRNLSVFPEKFQVIRKKLTYILVI
ncbi:MAG: hypothetical protein OXE98_00390 [Hyphomicrobiales bacterium]|nr:hypothetical protein [Hyphomicrobiales bacterium]